MEIKGIAMTQRRAVQRFDRVAQVCRNMACKLYHTGQTTVFNNDVRYPKSKRPFVLALEVSSSLGLTLSLSVLRYKQALPVFDVIGRWDFRQPIALNGSGAQLCLKKPKHQMTAARGCELLQALTDWAHNPVEPDEVKWPKFLVPFQRGTERYDADKLKAYVDADLIATGLESLQTEALKADMTEVSGPMVYVNAAVAQDSDIQQAVETNKLVENYRPILGFADRNPLAFVKTIRIRRPNPAFSILRRRGVKVVDDTLANCGDVVNEMIAEMRLSFPDASLEDNDIYDALVHPKKPVFVNVAVPTAIKEAPKYVANVLRYSASKRAQKEAMDGELLTAAMNPDSPLLLSRVSAVQIASSSQLQELPNWLRGSILASVDWTPKNKTIGVREEATVAAEAAHG